MRYSEGIKKYHEDTKKRIFDEIIAAVEAENSADISHTDSVIATADQEKEGITMKNTNEGARIRSSRGSVIAAACAVLVIGGGVFAVNKMSGEVDVTPPGSVGTSLTTDGEDNNVEEIAIPDVLGLDGEAAYDELTAAGFDVLWRTTYNETVEAGLVAYTEPAVTEMAPVGSRVTMYVSEGALEIPDGWWEGIEPAFAEMVDNADFIGEVQIINSMKETIDGVEYIDYFCAMHDDDGNSGTVFKYTGEGEFPNRLSIMQRAQDGVKTLQPGDKVLVMAQNGVQSESGGFSLELSETNAVFRLDKELECYVNVNSGSDEFLKGLYESSLESYYKNRLHEATQVGGENDISGLTNWCEYNDIKWDVVEEPNDPWNNFEKGDVVSIEWYLNDGVIITVCNGEKSERVPEQTVDTTGKGKILEGFEGYNIELSEVYCYSETGVSVIFSISHSDGTPFPEDYLAKFYHQYVGFSYGDLEPLMASVNANRATNGGVWMDEDNIHINISCMADGSDGDDGAYVKVLQRLDGPAKKTNDSNEVTMQITEFIEGDNVVSTGLYEVTFEVNNPFAPIECE